MKGYKGFDPDLCCRGFQYEVGKTYEMEELPSICEKGFHFANTLADAEAYYPLFERFCFSNPDREISMLTKNRYCEIEAIGEIVGDKYSTKLATNKIRIVRELSKEEILGSIGYFLHYRYDEGDINRIIDYLTDKSEVEG